MSDLISLQIKQLKEAKYILKLWMINYIKKKTRVWEWERKEQWSIILLPLLGQMDILKATCFQLQIIATFGLQWSAINPSAYVFFPPAQFQPFHSLLTTALCSRQSFYQESRLKIKIKGITTNTGFQIVHSKCAFVICSRLRASCLIYILLRI